MDIFESQNLLEFSDGFIRVNCNWERSTQIRTNFLLSNICCNLMLGVETSGEF